MMKFKFDPNLEFQKDAIKSVVDLFDGQPFGQANFQIEGQQRSFLQGVGNNFVLNEEQLLTNTHKIQEQNNIPKVNSLQGMNFSIEMETGTGKTYVYLRTLFELNKHYGFKKFIVVVPSIAIREGVLKSISLMKEHFKDQYEKIPFECHLYDSKRLNNIRNFRDSNDIQIMVMNIQAFQRDISEEEISLVNQIESQQKSNVIYRDNDRMGGRPIDFISSTCPIVIIDEPQSVDNTPKSQAAITKLKPAVILRYSATHRNPYNLLYKLGPIEAYDQRLVKRIEIASIHAEEDYSSAYVKYLYGENKKRGHSGIRAILEIHKKTATGIKIDKIAVKQNDDLYHKSGNHLPYRQGFIVKNIDIIEQHGYVEFSRGQRLPIGKTIGSNNQDVMKVMVQETIEQHLKKEASVKGQGIKVLSLFFIDHVSNYRIYNQDGTTSLGKIGEWFEKCYNEFIQKPQYKDLISFRTADIHNGYFSKDKKGRTKDTRGNTKDDEDTYSLIMRDKERLLDPSQPLRFIFSHTALREGWDNPNVFQICTLREVGSEIDRRQQIGRGLRLPVNQKGERLHDTSLNRLTVIASEGYEEYARALQNEYEEELGVKFGIIEKHTFSKITYRDEKGIEKEIGQNESGQIWESLRENKYISSSGEIQNSFDPYNETFVLKIDSTFEDLTDKIIDEMKKYIFKDRIINAHKRKKVKFKKQVYLREDFKQLWEKISQKTRYSVFYNTEDLIKKSIDKVKNMNKIGPIRITSTRADLEPTLAGIEAIATTSPLKYNEIKPDQLPDIISYLQEKTQLTRYTLVTILCGAKRMGDFLKNPYQFMENVANEISFSMKELMLENIQYKKINEELWEMQKIEKEAEKAITGYIKNLYEIKNQEKSLYDFIEFESEIEKHFARDLDNNEHVKLFVKLPRWFKIDTPIGPYNPDWAFVTEREEKLYFVRETKSTTNLDKLRPEEKQKVKCGHRHFEEIGTNFDVVTSLKEVEF